MKSKFKITAVVVLVVASITAVFIALEDQVKGFFTPSTSDDAVDKTPPASAASLAKEEDEYVLGDEIINMVAAQDYTLTVPVGAVKAQFQAQGNDVLLRLGASPMMGGFLCDAEEIHTLETPEEIKKATFRTQTGNATLIVNYFSA